MKRALLLVGVLALAGTACSEEVPTEPAPNAVVALAAPANDDFDGAVQVTGVPFSYSESAGEATVAKGDPIGKKAAEVGCFADAQTLWFKFTATESARLTANTIGSNYDTELWLLTGSRRHLTILDCNDDLAGGGHPSRSSLTFDAVAGQTYYFMVAQTGVFVQPTDQLVFNLVPGRAGRHHDRRRPDQPGTARRGRSPGPRPARAGRSSSSTSWRRRGRRSATTSPGSTAMA